MRVRLGSLPRRTRRLATVISTLCTVAALGGFASAQQPSPEEIQRQREEAERKRLEYLDEKARVDHINAKVAAYKQLMASIPFEPVPNTSNMVQVFMNGHDLRDVASKIYSVSDGSSASGFVGSYWPMVLFLNRAKDYDGGLPRYGKLDPQTPDLNVALFPNIRKQGFTALVAPIENADSIMALEMTAPVVLEYRRRLQEEVQQLAARGGDVWIPDLPGALPAVSKTVLFPGTPTEPLNEYPARKSAYPQLYTTEGAVPVDLVVVLDPAPPASALRHGINMLGPQYEGYDLEYQPGKVLLQPEVGAIAFLGGRNAAGEPVTQPGTYLAFNQRLFGFLLTNESAFVAFSASQAPVVNGGSLSAGLDLDFKFINVAGMLGITGLRVVGETEVGPSYSARLRFPIGAHLFATGLYRFSDIEHFRVVDANNIGRSGVTRASYFGLGLTFR